MGRKAEGEVVSQADYQQPVREANSPKVASILTYKYINIYIPRLLPAQFSVKNVGC